MPAVTTHIECAKEIYHSLPIGKQAVMNNKKMFYLGSQGPDVFFFYKLGVPSRIKEIGNYLHDNQIFNVIKYMYNYVKSSGDYDLLAYYYGYLCHYSLDSIAHPLVFQRSRFGNLGDEPEIVIHYRIEAFIDKYILAKKNRTIKSFDAHKLIKISNEDIEKLANMYVSLFKDVLGLTVEPEKIERSCKDMVKALNVLKPNSKFKFNAIQNYEKLSGKDHTISSLMLYNDFENIDYVLNNDRLAFTNIYDETLVYNDSFDDLYQKAINKAVKIITEPLNENNFKLDFKGNYYE